MTNEHKLITNSKYGFKQINPTPSVDEVKNYYERLFYSDSYSQLNDSDLKLQQQDAEWLNSERRVWIKELEKILGKLEGRKLLDIGCGWCENIDFFSAHNIKCVGIDPARAAVEHGCKRGYEVICGSAESLVEALEDKRFDIVTMFNTLEHLREPIETIRTIHRSVLTNKGVLVVDVPNEFNLFQTVAKNKFELDEWWIAPPVHLNYFSPDSLQALLEGEGFSVESIMSSFPMEMFLLMGEDYVRNASIGRKCHESRMEFELTLRNAGKGKFLTQFYKKLAELGIGRQVICYATNSIDE